MNQEALDYFATSGRFTALDDAEFSSDDVGEVVQGLLVHDLVAEAFYGVEPGPAHAEAIHERDAARLLQIVQSVDGRPLHEARPAGRRVGARCHAFSRLTVAFLRGAGVPARARWTPDSTGSEADTTVTTRYGSARPSSTPSAADTRPSRRTHDPERGSRSPVQQEASSLVATSVSP